MNPLINTEAFPDASEKQITVHSPELAHGLRALLTIGQNQNVTIPSLGAHSPHATSRMPFPSEISHSETLYFAVPSPTSNPLERTYYEAVFGFVDGSDAPTVASVLPRQLGALQDHDPVKDGPLPTYKVDMVTGEVTQWAPREVAPGNVWGLWSAPDEQKVSSLAAGLFDGNRQVARLVTQGYLMDLYTERDTTAYARERRAAMAARAYQAASAAAARAAMQGSVGHRSGGAKRFLGRLFGNPA